MRPLRVAAAVLVLAFAAAAAGQCVVGKNASTMTLKGFGTASFQQIRTDTARGRIDFSGAVCIQGEALGWTLRAARVTVEGLARALSVTASDATVTYQGWQLTATTLVASHTHLTLRTVAIAGAEVTGTATSVAVDLTTGAMQLSAPVLHGSSFYVRGSGAQLDATGVTVDGPVITSCTCAPPHLYDVAGRQAHLDAQGTSVTLSGGRIVVGAVTIPLGEKVTLSAQALRDLAVPVKVAYVPTDKAASVTGTGLGVTVGPVRLAPGVQARLGATGLDPSYPLAGLALLDGHGSGSTFTFGLAPKGMRFQMTSDHALLPWLDAGFDTRVLEPGNRDTLREGLLHLRAHTALPAVNGDAALRMVAAASSQTPSSGEIAGPRLAATGSLRAQTGAAPWGRLRFRVQASRSLYPEQRASQWGVELQPGYRLQRGPWRVDLSYLARFTDSGSPFTTNLDRLEPAQRPSLHLSLDGALAPGWSGSLSVAASYDLVASPSLDAGLNRLDAVASLTRRIGAWQLRAGADAVLAGVIEPNGSRDGSLTGRISATDGGWEFGARARYTVAPDPLGLDLLELSAAIPIALPGVELRPYLALNFAPTLVDGSIPAISGHGLDVTFVTCCGALTLGYRDQDGTWSVKAAVDLQRRTGPASQAGGAPCPSSASAVATVSAVPGTCRAASSGTGIMAGAVAGPSP